ncbi:MAG: RidA family protein [Hyphomicrobiales bacterium]|nr:RidA family protein [Hyphomicrobiales bacterium]MCP5372981.1 RidA family protein [Hyphomicrobiales bacterium]
MEILNPPGWKRPKGYSNGITTRGRMVFVAGMVGWTGDEVFETDSFAGQARQAFRNIVDVLAQAGAGPEHIVRLTWFIGDKREYLDSLAEVGAAYREIMGSNWPVMAVIQVAGFIEDGAKLEIEATAVVPD